MIVVSDASPIVSLAAIGRLDLLRAVHSIVAIPNAVHAELLAGKSGATLLASNPWIERREVTDSAALGAVHAHLDEGETEAIALALQLNADVLLIDEKRGRAEAHRLGIRVVGLLGLLVEAKRDGVLSQVAPIVDELVNIAGFRVSVALHAEILASAGEQEA